MGTLTEDFYSHAFKATWSLRTQVVGEGPVSIGFAHDDYSVVEIEEALDVSLLGPGNKIEQERNRRLVRSVGAFDGLEVDEKMNNGVPVWTRTGFNVQSGKGMAIFGYNQSGANLTGSPVLRLTGYHKGRWIV